MSTHTRRGHATQSTLTFKVRSVLVKAVCRACVRSSCTRTQTHYSYVTCRIHFSARGARRSFINYTYTCLGISLTHLRAIRAMHNDASMQGWPVRTANARLDWEETTSPTASACRKIRSQRRERNTSTSIYAAI